MRFTSIPRFCSVSPTEPSATTTRIPHSCFWSRNEWTRNYSDCDQTVLIGRQHSR